MVTRRGVGSRKTSEHSKHNHSQHKETSNKDVSKVMNEDISPEEQEIIEKSFDVVKKLNKQVGNVEASKKRLEKQVEHLSKRVENQEDVPLHHNRILLKIKEEIIKEFTPLLNKIDIKGLKVDVFKEIEELIEVELDKIRSEFQGVEKKTKRTFTQALSDLEVRLIDSLKEQANLKQQLSRFESTHAPEILEDLEEKIENAIEGAKKTLRQDHIKQKKELEQVQLVVAGHEEEIKSALKDFKRNKTLLEKSLKETQKDSGQLESKVLAVEKELSSLQSLVEKYEEDLYSKEKQEELDIQKVVKDRLSKTEKLLKEFSKVKEAHEAFLAKKVNAIIDDVKSFEDRLKEIEKKEGEKIKDYAQQITQRAVTKQEKEFDKFLKDSQKKFSKEISNLTKNSTNLEKSFKEFKTESSGLLKNYISHVDKELSSIRKLAQSEQVAREKFSKEEQETLKNIVKQTDDKFQAMSKELKAFEDFIKKKESDFEQEQKQFLQGAKKEFEDFKKELSVENAEVLDSEMKKTKEDLSKEILKIQDFITRSSTDMKEATRDIKEDLENKFYQIKLTYDETIDKHISQIENEFAQKETSFVQKISTLEQEKDYVFGQVDNFKTEVAALTKEFSTTIDDELKTLKKEHIDFEKHKQEFIDKIDNLTHTRKVQLHEDYDTYKEQLELMLSSYKKTLLSQEDTFRQVFSEKINSLWEYMNQKLNTIEKKFVEKNVGEVKKLFATQKQELQDYEKTLDQKSKDLDNKLETSEKRELDFFEDLHLEQTELQEKVEERLISLEQQINKRFLDLDEDFSHVKGVVLDEVEGLMRDITKGFDNKIASMNTYETKLKFALTEAMKKLQELSNVNEFVESQVRDVRDEVNDLRVKVDVLDPHSTFGSIHSLVATMADYESHLQGLMSSLKAKGVSDEHVLDLLVSKGHPRVYASILLKEQKKTMNR